MGGLHVLNSWNWTSAAMAVFPRVYHSLRHKIVGVLLLICVCFPLESLTIGIGKDIHKWLFSYIVIHMSYVYVYYLRMQTFMLFVSHLSSKGPDTQLRRHLMTSPMMIFPRGFHVEEEHQVSGLLFQGNQLHDDDLRHAKSTNCAFPVGSMTLGFTMSFHVLSCFLFKSQNTTDST